MKSQMIMARSVVRAAAFAAIGLMAGSAAHALTVLDFAWEGQVAGIGVEGRFSYDETKIPADAVIRKANLLSFDVSFYDPQDNLLRRYQDNHLTYADFNFNYDTATRRILQDGGYPDPDGIDIGEYRVVVPGESATGLNFWSRPLGASAAHVHVNDWGNEFGLPRAFGGHQDVAFFGFTTQALVDSGGVGADYLGNPNFSLDATGLRMMITTPAPVPLPPAALLLAGGLGLMGATRRRR